jgi:hypothetical protein
MFEFIKTKTNRNRNKTLRKKTNRKKTNRKKKISNKKKGGFLIELFNSSISKTQSPACSQYTSDKSGCSQYSNILTLQKQTQSDSQYDLNPISLSNNDKPSINSSCSGISGGIVGCSNAQHQRNENSYNSSLSETTGKRSC